MDSVGKVIMAIFCIGCIILIIACIWGIADMKGATNNQMCSRCGSHSVIEIASYNEYGVYSTTNVKTIKYKCNNCAYYYSISK